MSPACLWNEMRSVLCETSTTWYSRSSLGLWNAARTGLHLCRTMHLLMKPEHQPWEQCIQQWRQKKQTYWHECSGQREVQKEPFWHFSFFLFVCEWWHEEKRRLRPKEPWGRGVTGPSQSGSHISTVLVCLQMGGLRRFSDIHSQPKPQKYDF